MDPFVPEFMRLGSPHSLLFLDIDIILRWIIYFLSCLKLDFLNEYTFYFLRPSLFFRLFLVFGVCFEFNLIFFVFCYAIKYFLFFYFGFVNFRFPPFHQYQSFHSQFPLFPLQQPLKWSLNLTNPQFIHRYCFSVSNLAL